MSVEIYLNTTESKMCIRDRNRIGCCSKKFAVWMVSNPSEERGYISWRLVGGWKEIVKGGGKIGEVAEILLGYQ